MPIPTSAPISGSDIQAEFGSNSLSACAAAAGLSAPVSFSDFAGLSNAALNNSWSNKTAIEFGNESAMASFSFKNDGTWVATGITGANWLDGGTPSDYEIYVAKGPGDTPSGTLNTWLSLGTTRTWAIGSFGNERKTVTLSVQIRQKTNQSNIISGNIALDASSIGAPEM